MPLSRCSLFVIPSTTLHVKSMIVINAIMVEFKWIEVINQLIANVKAFFLNFLFGSYCVFFGGNYWRILLLAWIKWSRAIQVRCDNDYIVGSSGFKNRFGQSLSAVGALCCCCCCCCLGTWGVFTVAVKQSSSYKVVCVFWSSNSYWNVSSTCVCVCLCVCMAKAIIPSGATASHERTIKDS